MHPTRFSSALWALGVVLWIAVMLQPTDGDQCLNSKRDRHLTVMQEFRHSPDWKGIITEDDLKLSENITEVDLSKRGFGEVHWHLSSIAGEGYDILELDLSYNNLQQLNELTFLKFYSLEVLNLSNNLLTEVNNLTFGSLIRLVELDLSFNMIHTIEKEAFSRLYGLETLNLHENCLITLNPHQFHFNDHLSSVLLNNNQLTFLPPVLFDSLTMVDEISEFDLSDNQFRRMPYFESKEIIFLRIDNNHIETLTVNSTFNVRALQMQNNSLYDADLFKFSKAEHIDLSHNRLDNIVGLHEMTELEYLDLSSNNVSRFDYNLKYSIRNIPSLVTLRLRNCSLNDGNIEGLLASESILNLDLSQNSFVSLNFSHLSKLRSLQYVSLNFNYLKELVDYEHISGKFPFLELLSLSFNRWNCSYFDQLNKYLNESRIRTTTDPRDCYINGTHVSDSDLTDSFEPEYTMSHVKRDMTILRNLGRNIMYFLYAVFSTIRSQANDTHTHQMLQDYQLDKMRSELDRLVGMVTFMVVVFCIAMVTITGYYGYRFYQRWSLSRSVKVVTYNKRTTGNEFSNGVTVNDIVRDNASV